MAGPIEPCERCSKPAVIALRFDEDDELRHYCAVCAELVQQERTEPRFVIRIEGAQSMGWRCACGRTVATSSAADAARMWNEHAADCPDAHRS